MSKEGDSDASSYETEDSCSQCLGSEDTVLILEGSDSDENFEMTSATPDDDSTSVEDEPDDILDMSSSGGLNKGKIAIEQSEDERSDGETELNCNENATMDNQEVELEKAMARNNGENQPAKRGRTKTKKNSAIPAKIKTTKALKKYDSHLRTKCSLTKMCKIESILQDADKMVPMIHAMGFAPILRISYIQMSRELLKILVDRFDPDESVIKDHTGKKVKIDKSDIAEAIGFDYTGTKVPTVASPTDMQEVMENVPDLVLANL